MYVPSAHAARVPERQAAARLRRLGAHDQRPCERRAPQPVLDAIRDEVRIIGALPVICTMSGMRAPFCVARVIATGAWPVLRSRRRADERCEVALPLDRLLAREALHAVRDGEPEALLDELRRRQLRRQQAVADVDLRRASTSRRPPSAPSPSGSRFFTLRPHVGVRLQARRRAGLDLRSARPAARTCSRACRPAPRS